MEAEHYRGFLPLNDNATWEPGVFVQCRVLLADPGLSVKFNQFPEYNSELSESSTYCTSWLGGNERERIILRTYDDIC